MKKDVKSQETERPNFDGYLYEVASKYQEQLQYLNDRKENIKRVSILYATLITVLVAIIAGLYSTGIFPYNPFSNTLPIIAGGFGAIFTSLYYSQYSSIQSKINQTLNRMRLEEKLSGSRETTAVSSQNPNEEYFSKLVEINIENLSAYYEQVKAHANKSFIASLLMSILGFVIIVTGLAVSFGMNNQRELLIFVSSGSGIITEAIAALFFYLYTQTVHQMKDYHDGLLYVQNILLSLKLIEGIDGVEPQIKAESINKLVEYLLKQKTPK
jgi:hypothetical protein